MLYLRLYMYSMFYFSHTKTKRYSAVISGIVSLVLIAGFFTPVVSVLAQQSDLQVAQSDRAKLEADLKQLEAEIAAKQQQLNGQKGQSASLSRDISILKTQIGKAQLDIKSKNLTISKLSGEITSKVAKIETLEEKVARERDSLAQLLRKTNEVQQNSIVHVLLSDKSLSEFYQDLDSFQSINEGIKHSLNTIRGIQDETELEKKTLEQKQDQELDARAAIEKNKKSIETDQKEQQKLLSFSQNKEKEYQADIAAKEKKAAEIKARLFSFAGGQTKAIPFGTAITYAESAQNRTGVPAAFVLAILTQESNLGSNVGKCYLSNTSTGAGFDINTKETFTNVMKPTRDVKPFIEITSRYGMDYAKTVISCPIKGVAGWGGAMGPAQFIPSTWKTVEARVAAITGSSNPWNAQDSITASSTYLSDLSASSSYASQIRAACRYYGSGGSTCTYGKQVMARVASIQADIDYLKQYGVSRR
jgi:membrane-bound lytic murein transglycosylase B